MLLRRLAVGGMAEILLARVDGAPTDAPPVVVKRLHRHLAEDDSFVGMFLDEARIVACLDHPGIARVFDLGAEEGEIYLVMEFVPGFHLRAISNAGLARGHTMPAPIVARILADLCRALHYAHERTDLHGRPMNVVHRDVTPTNVMLDLEGRVKLLDFGIAKAATSSESTKAGVLKGKFRYMAPEQARGEPVDRRTDVFAAGVMLYELTVGVGPFERPNEAAVLRAVLKDDPVPPSRRVPGYPEALERILERALAKNAADRYPSAGELRRDLERYVASTASPVGPRELIAYVRDVGLLGEDEAATSLHELPEASDGFPAIDVSFTSTLTLPVLPGPSGLRQLLPFVGRERQVGRLVEAAQRARPGPIRILVVGDEGVGRTRFLEEVAKRLEAGGVRVLRAAGRPGGELLLLEQVVRSVARAGAAPPGEAAARLTAEAHALLGAEAGTQIAALTGQLVGLPFEQHPAVRLFRGDEELFRTRAVEAVRALLVELGRRAPVAILVDDADRAERDAVALLEEVLGSGVPALLAATVAHVVPPGGGTPALAGAEVVELPRLTPTLLVELLEGAGVQRSLAEIVARRAEGTPLAALELLRLAHQGVAPDELPEGLEAAMRARLSALSQAEREALGRAAVLGAPVRRGDVAEVGTPEMVEALEGLVARGILEPTAPGEYRFTRERWRDVASSAVPASTRQALHRLAAVRLVAGGGERDLLGAAHHYERAGEPDRAAHTLLGAGDRARDRFASAAAAHLYEAALGFAQDAALRISILCRIEEAWGTAGDRGRQEAALDRLDELARDADDAVRSEAMLRRLHFVQRSAGIGELVTLATEVAQAKRAVGDPAGEGQALLALAAAELFRGRTGAATDAVAGAARLGRRSRDDVLLARALALAGNVRSAEGDYLRAQRHYRRALQMATDAGEARLAANWLSHLAESHLHLGEVDRAVELREQALGLMRTLGHRWGEAFTLLNLANTYRRAGRPDEGIAVARESVRLLDESQDLFHGAFARAYLALCLLERSAEGDADVARSAGLDAAELAREVGNPTAEVEGLAAAAIASLHQGELVEATALSRQAYQVLRTRGPLVEFEADALYYHHKVMRHVAQEAEASQALDAAYRKVRAASAKIRDPAARERFLARVPINRVIIASYRRRATR